MSSANTSSISDAKFGYSSSFFFYPEENIRLHNESRCVTRANPILPCRAEHQDKILSYALNCQKISLPTLRQADVSYIRSAGIRPF